MYIENDTWTENKFQTFARMASKEKKEGVYVDFAHLLIIMIEIKLHTFKRN